MSKSVMALATMSKPRFSVTVLLDERSAETKDETGTAEQGQQEEANCNHHRPVSVLFDRVPSRVFVMGCSYCLIEPPDVRLP